MDRNELRKLYKRGVITIEEYKEELWFIKLTSKRNDPRRTRIGFDVINK